MNAPRLVGKEFVQHMRDSDGTGSPASAGKWVKDKGGIPHPEQISSPNKKESRPPAGFKDARTTTPNRTAFERRLKTLKKTQPAVYAQLVRRMAK